MPMQMTGSSLAPLPKSKLAVKSVGDVLNEGAPPGTVVFSNTRIPFMWLVKMSAFPSQL